jgi:hypothetical protein
MSSTNPSVRTIPMGLLAGATVLFALAVFLLACPPGRVRVVTLGFAALTTYAGTAMYVARKRFFLSHLGTLHAWMIGHMVLGALMLVFVMLHAGFNDIGTQGLVLYTLTFAEVGTGFWGMYELRATPRRFAAFASDDYRYPSAVRKRIAVLLGNVDRLRERRKEPFKEWLDERYGAVIRGESSDVAPCEDFPRSDKRQAAEVHEDLEQIVRLRKLQIRIDQVDKISRRWLHFHVPTSVALMTFIVIHIAGWVYY